MKRLGKNMCVAACCAAAGVPMLLTSCGGGNRESMEFESYEYNYVAEELKPDSLSADTLPAQWLCEGSGMLPVKIGKHDVKQLRDTLMSIARVSIKGDKSEPLLPEGYSDKLLQADGKKNPGSVVVNQLAVTLMTPEVMVWQNYHYAYPAGAAHGVYEHTYINYSLADGRILTFSTLFKHGTESAVKTMLRDMLSRRDDLIVDLDEVEIPDNFRVTTDGVTFVYPLYSVAPYSSGEVEVPLDKYSLSGMLSDYAKNSVFKGQ